MEPFALLFVIVIAVGRGLSGRRDRRSRATVARALNGLPTSREARFAVLPKGRFRR